MHVAIRSHFNTYSHPRYYICFLSTFVQFYILTFLYVQCILQPCVFLFSSVLYVDCTWDKSEMTSIKTCLYNNSRKSKVIPIDNVYTICKWCISLMSSVYCSDLDIWPDSMKDTIVKSLLKVTNTVEIIDPWWRHQMETFFALLAFCEGNSTVTVEFPSQRPVTRNFDVSLICASPKRLSKPSRRQWFETSSRSLWLHCNVIFLP